MNEIGMKLGQLMNINYKRMICRHTMTIKLGECEHKDEEKKDYIYMKKESKNIKSK